MQKLQENKRAVRLFLCATFFSGLYFYAPIAGLYRLQYGLSMLQITLIESIMMAVMLLLELPWGVVTARIGYKKTLVLSGLLDVLAAVLFLYADGFGAFLVQRMVMAVAVSGLSGCDVAYLCRLVPPNAQAKVLGRYNAVCYAPLFVVGLCFSALEPFGYRNLALFSLIGCVVGAALRLLLPEVPAEAADRLPLRQQLKALHQLLLRNPLFLVLVFCGTVLFEAEHTINVFFASPAWAAVGISAQWYGLLNLSLTVCGVLAGLCSARLLRRFGTGRSLLTCWLVAAVCALGAWRWFGVLALVVLLPLLRFATECYRPMEQLLKYQKSTGVGRAVGISAYNMVSGVAGLFVGPLLGAAQTEQNGIGVAAVLLCGFGCVAAICWRRLAPQFEAQ